MSRGTEAPVKRLVAAAVIVLIVQTTVISQVPPFAGSADIVPLAAMSIGLMFGPLTGAVFGFGIGLGLDLLLGLPLGQYALLDLAVGYGSGRLVELRAPTGSAFLLPLGAAAAAVSTLGYGLLQIVLGGGAELSLAVARQAVLALIWGGLLAVPVNAAVGRIIGHRRGGAPQRKGRSRAYATGGLSPLTPGRNR